MQVYHQNIPSGSKYLIPASPKHNSEYSSLILGKQPKAVGSSKLSTEVGLDVVNPPLPPTFSLCAFALNFVFIALIQESLEKSDCHTVMG
jgi:hypothetical protein